MHFPLGKTQALCFLTTTDWCYNLQSINSNTSALIKLWIPVLKKKEEKRQNILFCFSTDPDVKASAGLNTWMHAEHVPVSCCRWDALMQNKIPFTRYVPINICNSKIFGSQFGEWPSFFPPWSQYIITIINIFTSIWINLSVLCKQY